MCARMEFGLILCEVILESHTRDDWMFKILYDGHVKMFNVPFVFEIFIR